MLGRIIRAIISIAVGIIPLIYLAGYLQPLGFPSPYPGLLSGNSTSTGSFGLPSGSGAIVPFGAFGITGLIIWSILSQIGSVASSGMSAPKLNLPNFANFPFMGPQSLGIPQDLPKDITKTQYLILKAYRQGSKKSKDIAKSLSLDKKDVDSQTNALKTNGYLTKDNKMTIKGLELLGG